MDAKNLSKGSSLSSAQASNSSTMSHLPVPQTTSTSSSSTVSAFDTFHPFPRLALELRLKVWYQALPDGRVVEIEWQASPELWFCPRASQPKACALLLVCKESRKEYLRRYQVLIDRVVHYMNTGNDHHKYINFVSPLCYFDPTVDTLYLGGSQDDGLSISERSIALLADMTCLAELRFLACQFEEHWDSTIDQGPPYQSHLPWISGLGKGLSELLSRTEKIEKLMVVVDDVDWRSWGRRDLVPEKPTGDIKLVQLTRGPYQDELPEGIEGKMETWMRAVLDQPGQSSFAELNIIIRQAMRGDELMKIDTVGVLTDWGKLFNEDREQYDNAIMY